MSIKTKFDKIKIKKRKVDPSIIKSGHRTFKPAPKFADRRLKRLHTRATIKRDRFSEEE